MQTLIYAVFTTFNFIGYHTVESVATVKIQEKVLTGTAITIGPFPEMPKERHQQQMQKALDSAKGTRKYFIFSPGDYTLIDPKGITVPTGSTLIMEGARFHLAPSLQEDGQAFLLKDVSGITWKGGTILGQREQWGPGVNMAGLRILGACQDIRISNLTCRNLSSNAVGVFGESDENPIRNIALTQVVGSHCCNGYGDYLSDHPGPAPGSERKDQGTVAMYHVDGWLVDGCRFENSHSDGTHFDHSHNGRFVNCVVSGSKMGGYFLENCEFVVAAGNIFNDNGSRGVTIERNSQYCILSNNIIRSSGREGLWAAEVQGLLVQGNVFRENGRKDDGPRDSEIRLDNSAVYKLNTDAIRIENNLFYTSPRQTAVLFMGKGMNGRVVLKNNTLTGDAPERVNASPGSHLPHNGNSR